MDIIEQNSEVLQAIASLIGTILIPIGFYLVWRQIIQLNKSIRSNTNNYVYTQTNEFINFIIEKDIRKYFYENVSVNKKNKTEFIDVACEKACCLFEFILLEEDNYKKGIFDNWKEWVSFVYLNSPALRKYIESEKKSWYANELRDFFETIKWENYEN